MVELPFREVTVTISSPEYKRVFDHYLRTGTPIVLSKKQYRPTTHYVWRTRQDGNVRPSHAANDGKIFAWDNPPPTGHPGEDYGCRCTAVPFVPFVAETVEILLGDVSDRGPEWTNLDFVNHYIYGNGQSVLLRDTGHLTKVVKAFMNQAEERLKRQIVRQARSVGNGEFTYSFERVYQVKNIVFILDNTTILGRVNSNVRGFNNNITMDGTIKFSLKDRFTDPLNIAHLLGDGWEWDPLGTMPYDIRDAWTGRLKAMVSANPSNSRY